MAKQMVLPMKPWMNAASKLCMCDPNSQMFIHECAFSVSFGFTKVDPKVDSIVNMRRGMQWIMRDNCFSFLKGGSSGTLGLKMISSSKVRKTELYSTNTSWMLGLEIFEVQEAKEILKSLHLIGIQVLDGIPWLIVQLDIDVIIFASCGMKRNKAVLIFGVCISLFVSFWIKQMFHQLMSKNIELNYLNFQKCNRLSWYTIL